MNICVIGCGYVGITCAVCFSRLGYRVVGLDNDPGKVKLLQQKKPPIYEQYLEEFLVQDGGNLSFTYDPSVLAEAEVVFITVPTPVSIEGNWDLSYLESAAHSISEHISGHTLIVNKCTAPVGTTEKVGQWITEAGVSPSEFEVLSNPEFLRQSTAILDFLHPYRIIIGGHSQEQRERLRHIFSPIINQDFPSPIPECSWQISTPVPTLLTTPRTAEMIKYASNAFLATKISYINEVGNICREYGVDVNEVARGMGLDSRISPSFLEAGVGFGGSCLPKDTRALIGMGKTVGYQPKLLEAVLEVNREQPLKMVKLAESRVGDLAHKKVAVLGAAFKAGTDDTRESVAFTVVDELLTKKALPVIYDPMALEKVRQRFGDTIIYAGSAREAIIQCDCVLITTAWEEFRDTTLYDGKVVIDGRSTLSGIDSIEYERIC